MDRSRLSKPEGKEVGREIFCADAVDWFRASPVLEGASVFASLPDYSEFPGRTLEEWKEWFRETARLLMEKTSPEGATLFFQSDIKVDGVWIDKAYLCQRAAEAAGHSLVFHQIYCRTPVGTPSYGRPGYSHLLAFSRDLRGTPARGRADVVDDVGEKTWARGTGIAAARAVCRFVAEETKTKILVNPFCGEGAIVAMANYFGLQSVGIDRSPKRAEKARRLQVEITGKGWEE